MPTANLFCPNCAAIVRAIMVTAVVDGGTNYPAWLCGQCMLVIRPVIDAELEAA